MNVRLPRIVGLLSLLFAACAVAAPPRFDDGQPRPVTRTFRLRELLEHAYSNELVSFTVTFAPDKCREASLRLVDDAAGRDILFQLSEVERDADGDGLRGAKTWFWVDSLPALAERTYTLYGSASGKCRPPSFGRSPVTWSDPGRDTVEVANGVFSLRLAGTAAFPEPKRASEVGGPLRGFKGADGQWRGAGEFEVESPVAGHTFRVVEQGPLWVTFASRFQFVSPPGTGGTGTGPFYEMRFQVFPGQDFCRVTEKSDFPLRLQPMRRDVTSISDDPQVTDNWRVVPCPADNFILNCDAGWKADRLYTHAVFSTKFLNHPLLPDQFRSHTALRPALPFMNAGWFAVHATQGQDLLGLVGIDASHWQYPDNAEHFTAGTPGRNAEILFVNEPGRGAFFRLPLARMERHWLLVVTTHNKVVRDPQWVAAQKKPSCMRHFADRIEPETCYLWQLRYQWGDLPLNKVKDWVVDYDEPQTEHPGLFPEARDRQKVLQNVASLPGLTNHFKTYLPSSPYLKYFNTGEYAETKYTDREPFDPGSGISCVKENLSQGYNAYIYVLSTGQYVPWMMTFSDIVAPGMRPEDWKRMCRFALAGTYILADDDYWQYTYVRNNTTYLPNFNTFRWSGIGLAGLFFRNHPDAPKWINLARYYLEKEFDYHISEDGVGEENVCNYYPVAWQSLTLFLRILNDRGIADYRRDPKYLAGGRFWVEVVTPPDPRLDPPRRMIPPIGNHPYSAPHFGQHEWNANTFQKVDPELAAWSHWCWLECGQPPAHHYTMPLNYFWASKDFAAQAPPLRSRWLKGFGYIFRNHFPGPKETYLTFKAGRTYFHHDGDEGSFHMYAKGIPLACDGLELIGYTRADVHNLVQIYEGDTNKWSGPRGGDVVAHLESPAVDWAAGFFAKENTRKMEFIQDKLHTTDWRRDIVLLKSRDPEGPEYFVVVDDLNGPDSASWNLDVHSEEPTVESATDGKPVTVRFPGIRRPEYNVGLDVVFVTPGACEIRTMKGTVNQAQKGNLPTVEHWFIRSPRGPSEDTLTVLYPRRPDQPAPTVTPLLNGRGCVVQHAGGRDFVFASDIPVQYAGEGIEFSGRLAVVRDRPGETSLTLLDGERLSFKGKSLTERGNAEL